jgi:hypothetical protein
LLLEHSLALVQVVLPLLPVLTVAVGALLLFLSPVPLAPVVVVAVVVATIVVATVIPVSIAVGLLAALDILLLLLLLLLLALPVANLILSLLFVTPSLV